MSGKSRKLDKSTGYLNHPLLQGPKRINGPRKSLEPNKLRPATVEEKAALETFRAEGNRYARVVYDVIPEPTSPAFDSTKHGLLAPPRTTYRKLY